MVVTAREIDSRSSVASADVLVVEDRDSLRTMLRRTLAAEGYQVLDAKSASDAVKLLSSARISVVLTDLRLPGGGSGRDVLKAAREADPNIPVIVMTAYGTVEDAVGAMKEGAFDFLAKPVDNEHLIVLMERAVSQRRLLMENLILKEEYAARFGFPEIVGEHPALEEASRALQRAAGSDTTVLLLGESGTGKELFARALHYLSPRRDGPFVAINCAAIPAELLENELFGHEKGAYTGATSRKLGKLELAANGTVLLDEIGELPLALQSKLLRVLQERAFERVGGTRTLSVDVRLVAATNRELKRAVERGEFREDLYFRLSVFPVSIPALRERSSDIPILARFYVERLCREMNKAPITIPEVCLDRLQAYSWPGNVRELANCLERAVILCDGSELGLEHLGLSLGAGAESAGEAADVEAFDLSGSLADVSRRASRRVEIAKIREVLREVGHDRARASELLQVSGKTLSNKIKEYGLYDPPPTGDGTE